MIHHRRPHDRTQNTTQVEAQVQLPAPVASHSEEKVESVSPSPSGSLKSCASLSLLPTTTAPRSGTAAIVEKPIEKLMAKTKTGEERTEEPLLRLLKAEIANSENSLPSRQVSHQFSSMRSTSLTSGPSTSSPAPSHSEPLPYSTVLARNSGQSSLPVRPSPTVVSMEVRPLESDAAALLDTGTMLVSGSFPSFSSCSSVIFLSSACHSADDGHTLSESEASKYSYASLDCEALRRMKHYPDAEQGTPSSSTASLSIMTTRRDSPFSSDAETVCEVRLGRTSLTVKALKFNDPLSFAVSVSDLSLNLSSDKSDDAFSSRPRSGPHDLSNLTKFSGVTKFEDGGLTMPTPPSSVRLAVPFRVFERPKVH
ncbi:hypothetical protein V8D89_008532 [Ganoderma adspersum]